METRDRTQSTTRTTSSRIPSSRSATGLLLFLATLLVGTGCLSSNSYLDPSFKGASYADLSAPASPHAVSLQTEFLRNGERLPQVDGEVRAHVNRVLNASRIVTISGRGDVSIRVAVNNLADMDAATSSGFKTGLTLGAAGSVVSDFYEIEIELVDANGRTHSKSYKHAIHTTIGNASPPEGAGVPMSPANAFSGVVEQAVLNFLRDMQAEGKLSLSIRLRRPIG